ncbi:MAG TPA: ribosome-associated translation inhibitor RaiA [Rhabdochlamydiaceae bacterium]|nr:ribosome-associated translation inhibitor RaiA [Rhabdochlamydiaceae bacterium]
MKKKVSDMAEKEKFAEEDSLGYNIFIVAKNFELTEPIKLYIWKKLSKIEKFHQHIFNMYVTLEIQRLEHVAVIICHFNHFKLKVEAHSTDVYASIDRAIDDMEKLFFRWKSKIQDYSAKKPMREIDMMVNVYRRPYNELEEINAEIEAENAKTWEFGKVIAKEKRPLRTLTTDEAIVKMELSGEHFLLYRDEVDQKLKVIYRREDQNYGIIQAEQEE